MRREESAPARAALGPALAMGAVLLLALVPFRVVFAHPLTTLLGTSNDSVHGTWSLWYLTDGGPADAFWPVGIVGTVIGGPSVLFGRAAAEAFGPVAAWSASCAAQTVVALLGVAALALRLGGGPWSAPGAALLLLCGRPLLAHVALGVPEGAAIGWFALALAVGLAKEPAGHAPRRALPHGAATGAQLGMSLVENPYSVPLVGLAAVGFAWVRVRARAWPRLLGEAAGGTVVLGLWYALSARGGALDPAAIGKTVQVLGFPYVAEGYDGRAHWAGLLRPWPLPRYAGARLTELLGGGGADYLGWVPLVAALGAVGLRVPRARACVLAGAVLVALAFGSFPFGEEAGIPGPYLYGNLVLGWIVRPLTQPVRLLVPAAAAFAVAGGLLLGRQLLARRRAVPAVLFTLATVECLTAGAPTTRIPTFDLSTWACLADLDPGPVATGAAHTAFETAGSAALAMQMVHGHPGTHGAIGGWRRREPRAGGLEAALKEVEAPSTTRAAMLAPLASAGVRWALLDADESPELDEARACGGVEAIDLQALPGR